MIDKKFLVLEQFPRIDCGVDRRLKSAARSLLRGAAGLLRPVLPLSVRKSLVAVVGRRKLPGCLEIAMGLLDDLRRRDPDEFHRFLWSNHLAYAERYEISKKFGPANINITRHTLFRNITSHLRWCGLDPDRDIRSVFEVGCSMGYLLRHIEEEVFRGAAILHGLDIDQYAVRTGSEHLASLRSRVQLFAADMESTDRIMNQNYDVVLCCGVLMYVNETIAQKVVRTMFARATKLVGLICLAPAETAPARSAMRESDGTFVHNVGAMIRDAGGRVVSSTWVGTDVSGSSDSHVILAEPF